MSSWDENAARAVAQNRRNAGLLPQRSCGCGGNHESCPVADGIQDLDELDAAVDFKPWADAREAYRVGDTYQNPQGVRLTIVGTLRAQERLGMIFVVRFPDEEHPMRLSSTELWATPEGLEDRGYVHV